MTTSLEISTTNSQQEISNIQGENVSLELNARTFL